MRARRPAALPPARDHRLGGRPALLADAGADGDGGRRLLRAGRQLRRRTGPLRGVGGGRRDRAAAGGPHARRTTRSSSPTGSPAAPSSNSSARVHSLHLAELLAGRVGRRQPTTRRLRPPRRPTRTGSSRRRTPTTGSARSSRSPRSTTAARSTCRSARRATRRRPRCSRRCRAGDTARGYPPSIGTRRAARGRRAVDRAPARRDRRPGHRGRRLRRHQGVRRLGAAVPQAARSVARHRALPGDQLPDLRDGRDARRLPRGALPHARRHRRADDAARALCVWVNSPGNPTGELHDLAAAAAWGRDARRAGALGRVLRRVHLGRPRRRRSCAQGTAGVLAVHSLSKRDNFAGARIGFYAGDAELVHYLREVRKHAGLMPPGPVQAAAVVALGDDAHVERQRERYRAPAGAAASRSCAACGLPGRAARRRVLPVGAAPGGDAWAAARDLARRGRHRRVAGRVLRARRRRATSGSPPSSRTSASSWPPRRVGA